MSEIATKTGTEPSKKVELTDAQVQEQLVQIGESVKSVTDATKPEAIRTMIGKELETDEFKETLTETVKTVMGDNSPEDGMNAGAAYVKKFAEAGRFDNLSIKHMVFGHELLKSSHGKDRVGGGTIQGPSEDFTKALAIRTVADATEAEQKWAAKEAAMKAAQLAGITSQNDVIEWMTNQAGMKMAALKAAKTAKFPRAFKADELQSSTLANYGDQWAGVMYSNTLWEEIMLGAPLLAKMPTIQIPMGSESVVIPVEGTPPQFYNVAQAADQAANPGYTTLTVATSRLRTNQSIATVRKFGAATTWTGEITEDLVVNYAPIAFAAIREEATHLFDALIINGDTVTGTTNINHIRNSGSIAASNPYLTYNGLRKLALTTTGKFASAGAAFSLSHVMDAVAMFGEGGAEGLDMNAVCMVGSVPFDLTMRGNTADIRNTERRFYRVENENITHVYGYEYIRSSDYCRESANRRENATGRISDTAGDNTRTSFVMFRPDQWRWCMKRGLTMEVERIPRADAYELTMLARVGLVSRAGSNSLATIIYNITP